MNSFLQNAAGMTGGLAMLAVWIHPPLVPKTIGWTWNALTPEASAAPRVVTQADIEFAANEMCMLLQRPGAALDQNKINFMFANRLRKYAGFKTSDAKAFKKFSKDLTGPTADWLLDNRPECAYRLYEIFGQQGDA